MIKVNVLLSLFSLFILVKKNKKTHLSAYIYIALLIIFFILSSFYVARYDWRLFAPLHFIIYSYGFSMILINRYVYTWGGYLVFYGLAAYFCILIILGVSGDIALKWSSSNGISTVMLISCISLYIILRLEEMELDLDTSQLMVYGHHGNLKMFVLCLRLIKIIN